MTDHTTHDLALARAERDAWQSTCEELHRAIAGRDVEIEAHLGRCEAADQRARSFGDLLATIADEAFGPFPIQSVDENIAAIERGIHDGIRAAQELAAIRDIVAPGNPQGTVVDAVRELRAARDAAIARAEKAEADLRKAVDAPRLAARKTPTVVASHGAVDLVRTASGEWGVRWRLEDVDDGATDTAWHLTEADARADFRDDTGTVSCESCARFIEHDDAHVDADGIYTCADETACSAAIRAKESAK